MFKLRLEIPHLEQKNQMQHRAFSSSYLSMLSSSIFYSIELSYTLYQVHCARHLQSTLLGRHFEGEEIYLLIISEEAFTVGHPCPSRRG